MNMWKSHPRYVLNCYRYMSKVAYLADKKSESWDASPIDPYFVAGKEVHVKDSFSVQKDYEYAQFQWISRSSLDETRFFPSVLFSG